MRLAAIATLARNCDKKEEVRDFISGWVNDKKEDIQIGAVRALGTLEDPGGNTACETSRQRRL